MQSKRFSPAPEYLKTLKREIRKSLGSDAVHESTWMGVEQSGHLVWSGSVEVFRLKSSGEKIFAWSKVEDGELHCYLVAEEDGIRSPREAVRRALCSQTLEDEELVLAD